LSFVRKANALTIIVVALIGGVISILDLTGTLDDVPWLKDRIAVLTLLVVGVVSIYLISEQAVASQTQEAILRSIRRSIASSSAIEVRTFDGRAAFWRYAAERIKSSERTIDDLTWGPAPPTAMTADDKLAYQEYRAAIAQATTGTGKNKTKVFREVMSFPNEVRIGRARPLMDDSRYPNYHLRYYDYNHNGSPSLLQYYIFDNWEVLISSRSQAGAALDNCFMTFKNKQLATIMSHYFEVIWRDAIDVRSGVLAEIEKDIRRREE
jgi:hypothetical protein